MGWGWVFNLLLASTLGSTGCGSDGDTSSFHCSREAFITIPGSGILNNKPGEDGQRRIEKPELCWPRSVCMPQCLEEALGDTGTGVFRGGGEETPKDTLLNPCLE